jgi:hypothetical protein
VWGISTGAFWVSAVLVLLAKPPHMRPADAHAAPLATAEAMR